MEAKQELDSIIRQVEPGTVADSSCQVLVAIDTRTGQPASQGLWAGLNKKHQRHFLVTNSHRSGSVAVRNGLKIGIADFTRDFRFDLLVDYEAKCNPGREVRVAQALWSGATPQERLESLLTRWVLKRLEGQASDFVRTFDRSAGDLAGELRTRAFDLTGLTLGIRVRLDGAEQIDSLRIGPLALAVRVRDGDDEVSLRFDAELIVDPGKESVAYLHRDSRLFLDKEIQRKVREYFLSEVNLQQFHVDLEGRVQTELWRCLDELIAPYGRRLSRLILGGEVFPGVVEVTKVEHCFSHRLRDYPEPVEVKTELLLQLCDLGRYVRAKTPDLERWANREVENAAIQSLFNVTYTELCLQYDEKKNEIERRMKDKAAAIGYELKQLVTITDLQFDVLRRPFLVRVADEFSTRIAKLKVRLEVNATLVIPHPRDIAALLDRRIDVKEQIRATLIDRIQQQLHEVTPESFYMEFETAKEEGQLPVRAQLEALIVKTVRGEFCAEVLGLSCKQLETDLSLRLERLMAPLHTFELKVVSSRGGPEVVFDGGFRVTGVDERGWIPFQTAAPEPDKLRECAIRHLQSVLADAALGHLLQTSNAEQLKRVNEWVQTRIQDEFGLRVRVMDWLRRPLEEEQRAAKARLSLVTDTVEEQETQIELTREMRGRRKDMLLQAADSRLEQTQKLQDKLSRLQISGDEPEVEQALRETIARLQEEQESALRRATADRSKTIVPSLRSARDILTEGVDPDVVPAGAAPSETTGAQAGPEASDGPASDEA